VVATHPEHWLEQWEDESRYALARRRRKRLACRTATARNRAIQKGQTDLFDKSIP